MNKKVYDVVIIGGGPAGCACALMLKQQSDLSILIIDHSDENTLRIGESIPPETRVLLQQLDLWQGFVNDNHDPCLGSCSLWGNDELGHNDYLFNPMGHGWHLNRRKFDQRLIQAAKDRGIDCWQKSTVYQVQSSTTDHQLTLKTATKRDRQLKAKFVVDATGRNGRFSKKMGSRKNMDDDMVCITGFFHQNNSAAINKNTLLEAVEYGWWYAARLPNNTVALALACDRCFSKKFSVYTFNNWHILLKKSTQKISTTIKSAQYIDNSLRVDLASSFVLDNTTGNNWLATGDAACAFDPISAGGIYKALTHGIAAAESIQLHFSGNNKALNDYQQLITGDYGHYLANKEHLYKQEQRWPHSPFWQHRQHQRKSLASALAH